MPGSDALMDNSFLISCRLPLQAEERHVGSVLEFPPAVRGRVFPLHLSAGALRGRQQQTKAGGGGTVGLAGGRKDDGNQRGRDGWTGNALDGGVAGAVEVSTDGA